VTANQGEARAGDPFDGLPLLIPVPQAAKLLGISRPTLYGLMEVHGIEIEPGKVVEPGAEADESRLDME